VEALAFAEVTESDRRLTAEVRALSGAAAATATRPGLSEERFRALDRSSDGDHGALAVGIAARRSDGDRLVGWAQIDGSDGRRTPTLEVVVHPDLDGSVTGSLADRALAAYVRAGGGPLRWWVGHAGAIDDERAAVRGFTIERDLLQLRCPLPLPARSRGRAPAPISTRPFRVGLDEPGWLAQNNRAFADHPEQGNWDRATLEAREAEPWFDPDGFRVLEVEGRIAGSCWTKVHRAEVPPLGEIYVIGVDPDFHGRGWGRSLTEDGFGWLAAQGLHDGMLYVDAANVAAVGLYTSMGLVLHHVDRAYATPAAVAPAFPGSPAR